MSSLLVAGGSVLSFAQVIPVQIEAGLHEADSLRRRRDFSKAWSRLSQIESLVPQMSLTQRAEFFKVSGDCHFGKDRFDEAIDVYRISRSLYHLDSSSTSRTKFVNLHTSIANALVAKGDFSAGRDTALLAMALARDTATLGQTPFQFALRALSGAAERLEDYDLALSSSKEALAIITANGGAESSAAAYVHNQLGVTYNRLGRFEDAIRSYTRAAEIFEKTDGPDSKTALAARSNVAITKQNYGHEDLAIPILEQKLEVYNRDPNSDRLALVTTLENLGSAQRRIGDLIAAKEYYQQALTLLRDVGTAPPIREVGILIKLANLQIGRREFESAQSSIDAALKAISKLENPPALEYGKLYNLLGFLYERRGNRRHALAAYQKAFDFGRQINSGFHPDATEVMPRYLSLLAESGQARAALDTIALLKRDLEALRKQLVGPLYIAQKGMLDAATAQAYAALDRLPDDWTIVADSLEASANRMLEYTGNSPSLRHLRQFSAQTLSAGSALDALAALRLKAALANGQSEPLPRELLAAMAVIDQYLEYASLLSRPPSLGSGTSSERASVREIRQRLSSYEQRLAELSADPGQAQSTRTAILDSTRILGKRLQQLVPPQPRDIGYANLERALNSLDVGRRIVVFHVVGQDVYAISATKQSVKAKLIGRLDRLSEQVLKYQAYCRQPEIGFGESLPLLQSGRALFGQLLGWIGEDELAQSPRITIVDSKPIEGLSFAALPIRLDGTPSSLREVVFAVQRFSFSYARSVRDGAKVLESIRPPMKLVAICPDFSESDKNVITEGPLPYARAEAQAVIDATNGRGLFSEQATLAGLLEAFAQANTLLLASHASTNSADGDFSYLVLRDSSGRTAERIYAQALAELDLDSELVVLSACETGSGRLVKGQGVMSLANVLRDAGVKTVINTLWRVDDQQSQHLILALYVALQEDELPMDMALAKAQNLHLAEAAAQFIHPFNWSGYTVTGDLRPFGKTHDTPAIMIGLGVILLGGTAAAYALIRKRRQKPTFADNAT